MLKITALVQSPAETVLALEGWVVGEDVELLAGEVERWLRQGKELVLDLRGVRSIDPAGLELLERGASRGLTWRGAGPYLHMLLEKRGLA